MTREQFINREIYVWGEDYIYALIDSGYEPKLTTDGWRWFAPLVVKERRALQTA